MTEHLNKWADILGQVAGITHVRANDLKILFYPRSLALKEITK